MRSIKRFLRSNEAVAKVVAVEMLETAVGGWALCVELAVDGGKRIGDHFDLSDVPNRRSADESRRFCEFEAATLESDGDGYLGRQVVLVRDSAGDVCGYRPLPVVPESDVDPPGSFERFEFTPAAEAEEVMP
ncbi:MAG: hypothetical protein GXX96_19975 [Planctomycetaceae bacterium]|nr:hypothetical protein [Planctomycetaceae bacterium]